MAVSQFLHERRPSSSSVSPGSPTAIAAIAAALHRMEIDWPSTKSKRRRATAGGAWWEAPQSPDPDASCEDLGLMGLVDALMLFASGSHLGTACVSGYCSEGGCGSSHYPGGIWVSSTQNPTGPSSAVLEPLVRALTQLANAAASTSMVRRQLISECAVHVPLLRLMQEPRAQLPLVVERCCRLVHWLCAGTPENRDVLGGYRCPATGGLPDSFVHAVLGVVEAHARQREVLANAFRALVALLPCPRVQEDLSRAQTRLLACLSLGGEILDEVVVRSVCRWLPAIARSVRRARKLAGLDDFNEGCNFDIPPEASSQFGTEGVRGCHHPETSVGFFNGTTARMQGCPRLTVRPYVSSCVQDEDAQMADVPMDV